MPTTNKPSRKRLESENRDPAEWDWDTIVDNRQVDASEPLDVISESWIVAYDVRSDYQFGGPTTPLEEKLEKNKNLDYRKEVGIREDIFAILESGKSKEEVIDLLVRRFDPDSEVVSSKTKTEFEAAAKTDSAPLPKYLIRYLDRKTYPDYAHMNPVEFLNALWGSQWKVDGVWTITQRQVNSFDDALLSNVRAHCRRNGPDAATILPPADVKRRPQSRPEDFAEGTADFKLAKIRQSQRDSMARRRSASKEFH